MHKWQVWLQHNNAQATHTQEKFLHVGLQGKVTECVNTCMSILRSGTRKTWHKHSANKRYKTNIFVWVFMMLPFVYTFAQICMYVCACQSNQGKFTLNFSSCTQFSHCKARSLSESIPNVLGFHWENFSIIFQKKKENKIIFFLKTKQNTDMR